MVVQFFAILFGLIAYRAYTRWAAARDAAQMQLLVSQLARRSMPSSELDERVRMLCAIIDGAPTVDEAAARIWALIGGRKATDDDDGAQDAPGVEYRLGEKSYDENGAEIEPTLPFERVSR